MKPTPEQIQRALSKRQASKLDLSGFLFPEQLSFVEDPSPFKVAVTSRRAGKTVSCAADLIASSSKEPHIVCLYITLSRNNAKKIIWPELKKIVRYFNLKVKWNESELSVEFENGSKIYCSGANDKSEIEKFRGLALKKVYIDECQSFPAYIEDLVNDVLGPALMDHAGTLALIGTPGPVPAGFFYDCSRSSSWTLHSWTFWDNPFIEEKSGKTHQEVFDRELKRRGVTKDDPSISREWFGQWILDVNSLVFKYQASVNDFSGTPVQGKYSYVMGVDLGYRDADAICVLGWNESSKVTYLVEELITRHQGLTELVEQIETLRRKYDFHKIVVDTAGLGKKLAEEMIRRYKIPIVPAEKVRKLEFIELMNDSLRTGQLLAKANSRFSQDCMKVEWDLDKSKADKKVVSTRFHSDICDAVLYAWRESFAFTHIPEPIKPIPGTPAWNKAESDKMYDEALQYFENLEEFNKDPFGE